MGDNNDANAIRMCVKSMSHLPTDIHEMMGFLEMQFFLHCVVGTRCAIYTYHHRIIINRWIIRVWMKKKGCRIVCNQKNKCVRIIYTLNMVHNSTRCVRHKEKFVDLSKRFAQINGAKASCNKTQECPTLFIFRKGWSWKYC